jgi:hypothetical protein
LVTKKIINVFISGSTIKLVKAYDKINNIGGYIIEAVGVNNLLYLFEINFIAAFQNYHHTRLSPVTNP